MCWPHRVGVSVCHLAFIAEISAPDFSPGSERNPLKMKVAVTYGEGLARPNGLKNPQKVHVIEMKFQPGLKKEREHAHQLCFASQ